MILQKHIGFCQNQELCNNQDFAKFTVGYAEMIEKQKVFVKNQDFVEFAVSTIGHYGHYDYAEMIEKTMFLQNNQDFAKFAVGTMGTMPK